MLLKEEKRNLFDVDKKYWFAHCISSDCAMGAGIAKDFQKKFHLKQILLQYPMEQRQHPNCIVVNNVFNLITKASYWNKPTEQSLKNALVFMKRWIVFHDVHYVAMPKIGCGLDRLQWGRVREIIYEVFDDIDNLEILVCYL